MAENTNNISQTVLQVDTGAAIKSVKEYKEYLEELKVILLGLQKGTDEYNAVAKLLRGEQEKLNDVMAAAKGKGDAVEGSYNHLSQTMSELKKEWKATADEVKRADLGKQINEINDQLKEMDASVGVYSRNVGNYANSFEEAFKTVLGEVGQVDGALGDLAKSTKSLIPLIKKTTSVATSGLSGIKKAIAATGIGALVLAVGLLISNFDALRKAVGITDEKFQEFKDKALNVLKIIVSGIFGVGNAILQFLIAPIKTTIELFKGLGNVVRDVFTGNFKQIKQDAADALKGIGEAFTSGFNFKQAFVRGKEVGEAFIDGIQSAGDGSADGSGGGSGGSSSGGKGNDKNGLATVDTSKFDSVIDKTLKARVEAEKQALKDQQELDKLMLEQEKETQTELQKILDEANQEYINSVIETRKKEEALLKERRDSYFEIAGSIGDIIGTIGDAWLEQVEAQIEAGEISEKEGKRQFEKIKALQIAEAIINTIAGAVGALMGITKDTGGWGIAAAISQAAAITTAGMAQVKKIQNTTIGSTQAATIPEINKVAETAMPSYIQTVTNQSDIDNLANAIGNTMKGVNLQVSVTEIDKAQNRVRTREQESSF